MISILRASQEHIPQLLPLFDSYREFYGQDSDLNAAQKFLEERFAKKQSIVLLALANKTVVGFTQLYTTYSSVSLQPIYILNDLYVHPAQRKRGIGERLLNAAKTLCIESRHKGLALETARGNPAQTLYEKLGWKKDSHCFHYFWASDKV